jgi:hypothetical protein
MGKEGGADYEYISLGRTSLLRRTRRLHSDVLEILPLSLVQVLLRLAVVE